MDPRRSLRSLRFSLPLLLLVYCGAVGLVAYVIANRIQEDRFEQEFASRELLRATELQSRTERAAERSELETGQREFGELGSLEEVQSAVFVSPDNHVLLTSRREWLNQRVDLALLGIPAADVPEVEAAMAAARDSQRAQSRFTNQRNGLVIALPAALPPQPGTLLVDRHALILLVFDLSFSKAVNRFHLQRQFGIAALAMLLAVLGLGFTVQWVVTRRLEGLQARMAEFAAGGAVNESPSRIDDEIGEIQTQFLSMATAIRHEMTERHDVEERLRDSESKFRAAMHFSPIGMALVALDDGRWLEVNPALSAILGYTRDELLAADGFMAITHPDDRATSAELNRRMVTREIDTFQIEKRYIHKTGRTVWAQLNTSLVLNNSGDAAYFVSQIQDITVRKETEAEVRRINRALLTISNCMQALAHATDEQALLDEVCRVVVQDGGYRFAWVGYPADEAFSKLDAVAHKGHEDGYLDTVKSVWAASGRSTFGPIRTAVVSGKPFVCRDYATDSEVVAWRNEAIKRGYRSSVVFPLHGADRKILGVLLIYSGEVNAFDEGEMSLLSEMAADLSYGIQSLRARKLQVEAEQTLKGNQAKLVLAMDMARLAPWEFDVETRTFEFNDTFYAQLRTTAVAEGGMLMPADTYARKFIPAAEQSIVRDEIEKCLATSDPHYTRRLEHRILRADGSIGMILVRFAIVKDAAGRTIRTYGVNQDITERRQADEALRISEERFRSAMSHSPIGMAIVAPDGRFTEVNSALCTIVGYTRDELVRTRFQAITHPDDLSRDLDSVRQLIDRTIESFQVEKRYLHKRGFIVWTQQNVSLVRDEHGRPRYFVKQVQDITERKRAAAELLALNERYFRHEAALALLTRSHVDHPNQLTKVLRDVTEVVAPTLNVARVGVWCPVDQNGTMGCLDQYDLNENRHVPGRTWTADECGAFVRTLAAAEVTVTYDVDDVIPTAEFAQSLQRSNGVTSVMYVPIRSQGQLVGVLFCGHVGPPRKWTPDEQTFAVAVANLLSSLISQVERQKLEEQLRQSQKLEGIGQLAGGVAHDFNNVLTVILGKAGQIAEDRRLPQDLREAADEISHSGQRAANLTRQLLAFSRRQAMEVHDVDLNQVVGSLARMLERVLGEHLSVTFSFAPEPAIVRADAGMVDQVVINLAVNARDAMPGGGKLLVETSLVDVDGATASRSGCAAGPYVCLRVTDTGSGIAPEHLPHIFEPFFTTKDVGKGTGLGLATSYGIIQQHQGWIDVDSEVGVGTTFTVFLPRLIGKVETPALVPPPSTRSASPAGAETILVVEDEEAVRSLIVDALESVGYHVLEARSGPRALEVWREFGESVDLLVTDMVMPGGLNGLELAVELKRGNPALRVIYMSGYLADVSREELMKAEGAAYLAKPFSLPALLSLVRQRLDAGIAVAGGPPTTTH